MFAGVRIYVRSVCPIQQVSTLATHCVSTLTNSQFGHVCRPREFSHKCRATDTKTESRPADIPGFCVAAVILFLVSKPRCPGLIKVREQAWKINRRITLGPALSQAMSLAGAHVSQTSTPGRDLGRPLEEHPPAASSPWASQPLPPVAARVLVPIPATRKAVTPSEICATSWASAPLRSRVLFLARPPPLRRLLCAGGGCGRIAERSGRCGRPCRPIGAE